MPGIGGVVNVAGAVCSRWRVLSALRNTASSPFTANLVSNNIRYLTLGAIDLS